MDGSRSLVAAISGFLLGVASQSFVSLGAWFPLALLFLGIIFIFFFWSERGPLFAFGVIVLGVACGAVWFSHDSARLDDANAWIEDGCKFEGRAVVLGDPEAKNSRLQVILRPEGQTARVLTYLSAYPRPGRGDVLTLSGGTFKKIKNFTDEFDYVQYQRAHGVLYELAFPKVESIEPAPAYSLDAFLGKARARFLSVFRRVLPEPHAALLGGVTIGADEGLDTLKPDFKIAGTSHIIVLSGYNITIVARVTQALMVGLGFWVSIWGGIVSVVLFTFMAGLGASSVRAAIMAVLALLAKSAGRQYDAGMALLYAAFVMVLLNPRVLIFDISFQLSALATLGILYGPDRISKYVAWIPERFGLREAATTTLAAQIFVVPFIVYVFGTLSLVSLPANIAILPFIPLVMLLGSLTGLIGLASTSLAFIFSVPVFVLLSYCINATHFFAAIPFASLSFGKGSFLVAGVLYLVIIGTLFPELWRRKK